MSYFEQQLARLPYFPGQTVMSSPTRSEAGSGNEDDQDEVGATNLANSLIASKEAMSVLGSALADQVVGALQAQGLVRSQDQLFGGQPAIPPGGQPYHMMGRGFGYPIPAHAPMQQPGHSLAPFLLPPDQYAWSGPHQGQFVRPNASRFGSPFDRLGPLDQSQPSTSQARRSDSGSSSSVAVSVTSEAGEEEGEGEDGDTLSLHPDWDIDLEPGQGSIDDGLKSFVKQCVQSPLTNQQRKKALEKYPLPNIPELRPPKLDMTMKLLVGKSICAHDSWLQKMQALCLDAYAPLLNLLNEQASGTQPSVEDLSSAVKCSLKLTGNIFSRLTKERRRKVLVGIHKDLAHMADEEFKQADVLFGEDVVERVKKRHDTLKTLRSVKQPFQKGGAQKRNRFGRRENQGFSHQGRYKAGQFKKPRFSFQQKGQSAPPKRD